MADTIGISIIYQYFDLPYQVSVFFKRQFLFISMLSLQSNITTGVIDYNTGRALCKTFIAV